MSSVDYEVLVAALERLDSLVGTAVVPWTCPVVSFGSVVHARIATVGINPSIREFATDSGAELSGTTRRLPTMSSLGLADWADADAHQLRAISDSCAGYFGNNPYEQWFRVLEYILRSTGYSYFGPHARACHLDLVPYVTSPKWGLLSGREQQVILSAASDILGMLLRNSRIECLILNGQAVVSQFRRLARGDLNVADAEAWTLIRGSGRVAGLAYSGIVTGVGGVALGRGIRVVGYNHNLQSSFGVTRTAVDAIRQWVAGELMPSTA